MENWKFIKNYENRYMISDLGNIKSLKKLHRNSDKILKPILQGGGYLAIDLGNGIKIKRFLIHRLVAENFLNNEYNKKQVNHINGIKTDNKLSNLEWVTASENQKHAIKTGLKSSKGEKNSQCKIKTADILNILNDKRKYKLISEQYKISISTISDIKRGYSWNHITNLKHKKK